MKFFLTLLLLLHTKILLSEQMIKKVSGFSKSEKYFLSDNTIISHYTNKGTWTNNKGNYGTESCKGTIVINPEGTIIDYLLFCNGEDYSGYSYTAKYQRTSDMAAGAGFYIFIDGTGPWKNRIGQKCKYAINYVKDAYFTTDICGISN